ncbi:MAG: iron ABC transporter permease [Gemmatimonadota bacterium]|nr:iron ABC transporter permease [Gemmatimonadota bacterium]
MAKALLKYHTKARGAWNALRDLQRQSGREFRRGLTPWTFSALGLVTLMTIPILVILLGSLGRRSEMWSHLASTVLSTYVINSTILMLGVGALSLLLGLIPAWLVSTHDFPGRRTFEWSLVLPLAIPTYIIAYTYAGLLEYDSVLPRALSAVWSGTEAWHLRSAIMSLKGAVVMMALVLYPYVYIIARASFMRQSGAVLETASALGRGPWDTFAKVALPMSRPAVVGGLTLVLMEVLNEYGAVRYFGVPTFTTGIFRAWFPLNDPIAAMRLSGILLLFVFMLIIFERLQRGRARFHDDAKGYRPTERRVLKGFPGWSAYGICLIPVALGFLIPVIQLMTWATSAGWDALDARFARLTLHSFSLALSTALLAVSAGLLIGYATRLSPTPILRLASKVAVLGYSIPGAVIAVGVFIPLVWADRLLNTLMTTAFNTPTGLLLSGTLVALIFAYMVRFLAVALNPLESGFKHLCGNLDETSRSLGVPPLKTLWKVDLPLLKGTLVSAALLVFVDVLKELPLTLILRPFNFDTLATRAFQLAADEQLTQSAIPALIIIAVGLVPVILLNRLIGRVGEEP